MWRLLIVDDEYHIREGLKHQIAQTGLPIEAVGAAEDGETALRLYEELKPDIVLLDINLPDLSGLEVARRIREKDEETQLLFLTGYNSMAFVREAITLETADYMLKPITKEELTSGLLRAEERISRRRRFSESHDTRKNQERYMTQEYALLDLLLQRRPCSDAIEALRAARAPLAEATPSFVVLCCEMDAIPERVSTMEDRQLYGVAFAKLTFEAAQTYAHAHGAATSYDRVLFVLSSVGRETATEVAKSIRSVVKNYLGVPVTIGVSRSVSELKWVPEAYREALHAAEHKGWVGSGQIIPYEGVQVAETTNRTLLDKELILLSEIRAGNDGAILTILQEWSVLFAGMPSRQVKLMATQLVLYVMRVVQSSQLTDGNFRYRQDPLLEVSRMTTGSEIVAFVTDYFVQVCKWIRESKESAVPKIFEDARHWIRDHLHEDSSLNGLAEYLHLSPKYVSSRFKQVTGESFADFLNRVRFERARELLLDPTQKVSQIAEAVGYGDTNYFSIAFKKNTGWTPSEFRKRYL
ncbi:response regulator [Cohnella endophytica]|uniref:Response regulator n=1 Tax=Cohnella endophytica TaxID=2419778 RepID=A0A494XWN6_9BACL|nr:response regulator [Cohnella endophytica]RKP54094.1 response regulator [Cohnella endophytica]